MEDDISCSQCNAIAQELSEAYTDAWDSTSEHTRKTWVEFYELILGSVEDVERAEQLQPPAVKSKYSHRINRACGSKFYHEAKTHHRVPWSFQVWLRSK